MKEKVTVVYHNVDMDGMCSAAIVNFFEKKSNPEVEINFIGYSYGEVDFMDKIEPRTRVYAVDISLPPEYMKKLRDNNDFIWIDHHASALTESKKEGYNKITGLRREGTAGCELAWEWFTHESQNLPYIVKILGRYDVWDLSYEPQSFWVNTYLYNEQLQPGIGKDKEWEQLFDIEDPSEVISEEEIKYKNLNEKYLVSNILKYGEILFNFQTNQQTIEANSKAFELLFDDGTKPYKFICANGGKGSNFFKSVLKDDHDFMMTFYVSKDSIVHYSLYTNNDKLDMGKLAKLLSSGLGGGHVGSAGFRTSKFPWELPHIKRITPE